MKFLGQVLILIIFVATLSESKIYTSCEFAQTLIDYGLVSSSDPELRFKLGNWVCLAYHESLLNTAATNNNTNGSRDYGIFQINNYYWCDSGFGYNECSMPCSDLLTDDIRDATNCAKLIYRVQGFFAWYGWIYNCRAQTETAIENWVKSCHF
ncbi:lysozyme c-1-like [Symsagittifera roscoffensis]|uniref:lysozyme c-1-like n=1 Tax=Symsagittifera roscoffensis TaxID=84072 RepID=UPI00307C3095